jgi:hypothetical protein
MTAERDERRLAHGLIDVHGEAAATVARSNASSAALSGQSVQAKSWIRILSIIQRKQADRVDNGKYDQPF